MPVVAFTAGSFGDILQVAGLAIKLAKGLYNQVDQHQIIEDLNGLAHVLLTAEQVASKAAAELAADQALLSPSLDSLRVEVRKCRGMLKTFIADLEKQQKPFNMKDVRGTWGKVQWIWNESNLLAEVQRKVENHTRNIQMFLSSMNMLGITIVSKSLSGLVLPPPQPCSALSTLVNGSVPTSNPTPSITTSQDPSADFGDSSLDSGQTSSLSGPYSSLAPSNASPPTPGLVQSEPVEQMYYAIPRTLLGRDCIQDMEELRDRLFAGHMNDEDLKRLESPVDTIFELLYSSSTFKPKDLERFCLRLLYYLGLGATKLATKVDVFWIRYGKYAILLQEQLGGPSPGEDIQTLLRQTILDLFSVREMYDVEHWGLGTGGGNAFLVQLAASVLLLVSCGSSTCAILHSNFQSHFDDETGCWHLGCRNIGD